MIVQGARNVGVQNYIKYHSYNETTLDWYAKTTTKVPSLLSFFSLVPFWLKQILAKGTN